MATITVSVLDDGTNVTITINPRQANITRDPNLQWVLDSPKWKWSLEPAGIQMAPNPPAPYVAWDGTPPEPVDLSDTYVAKGVPNTTGVPQLYKYTINLMNPSNQNTMRIDPDIANDPQG